MGEIKERDNEYIKWKHRNNVMWIRKDWKGELKKEQKKIKKQIKEYGNINERKNKLNGNIKEKLK